MTDDLILIHNQDLTVNQPVKNYVSGLRTEDGQRVMLTALNNIASIGGKTWVTLNWAGLTVIDIGVIVQRLAFLYAPSTANRHLAALRGVLRSCWKLELITIEQYNRLIDFEPIKGSRVPAGRDIPPNEARALLMNCLYSNEPIDIRDAAMIAILYRCGLRRAELVNLALQNFDAKEGTLSILGKGNKQRVVDVVRKTRTLLDRWLTIRGDEAGAIFVPINKSGKLTIRHLNSQSIFDMILKRAKNVDIKDISPHDFRRTIIGDLLDEGVDIASVAEIVGHDDVNTTRRYDRRGKRARRDAANKIDLPI